MTNIEGGIVNYEELKRELAEIAILVKQFPEPVQLRAFEMLTARLGDGARQTTPVRSGAPQPDLLEAPTAGTAKVEKKVSRRSTAKESYSIDRDLNLRGDESIPSFKAFVEEKKPVSAKEFNAVTVYYLTKLAGLESATLNHAYTCYSELKRKPPEHFKQSFTDTKNKEGWVEFDEEGDLRMPHRGVVFVEHDLPRAAKGSRNGE